MSSTLEAAWPGAARRSRPKFFYKYLSKGAAKAVLESCTLRWSTPGLFNDPADLQVDFGCTWDPQEVVNIAIEQLWRRCQGKSARSHNVVGQLIDQNRAYWHNLGKRRLAEAFSQGLTESVGLLPNHIAAFSEQVRTDLKKLKLLCLSGRHDSCLMWSHYAESHTGLALELRTIPELDSVYRLARPIHYSESPPEFASSTELAEILSGDRKLDTALVDRLIYTKSSDWQYEDEWRIASGEGRYPNAPTEDTPFFRQELATVYFGCNARSLEKTLIPLLRLRFPETRLMRAKRRTHTYKLTFELI